MKSRLCPAAILRFRRDPLLEAMRGADGLVDNQVLRRLKENGGTIVWAPAMAVTFVRPFPDGRAAEDAIRPRADYASLTERVPSHRM